MISIPDAVSVLYASTSVSFSDSGSTSPIIDNSSTVGVSASTKAGSIVGDSDSIVRVVVLEPVLVSVKIPVPLPLPLPVPLLVPLLVPVPLPVYYYYCDQQHYPYRSPAMHVTRGGGNST